MNPEHDKKLREKLKISQEGLDFNRANILRKIQKSLRAKGLPEPQSYEELMDILSRSKGKDELRK